MLVGYYRYLSDMPNYQIDLRLEQRAWPKLSLPSRVGICVLLFYLTSVVGVTIIYLQCNV